MPQIHTRKPILDDALKSVPHNTEDCIHVQCTCYMYKHSAKEIALFKAVRAHDKVSFAVLAFFTY